tara:strand:- start:106 stop:1125 length:1020 start_codon:yes stop_codon:yes gene_type:complete
MSKDWSEYRGDASSWNHFIEHNSYEFRQLYEWGEYKRKLGWQVIRLIYGSEGNIEAAAQILFRKKFMLGNLFIPGGICGDLSFINKDFYEILRRLLNVRYIYLRLDFVEHDDVAKREHLINQGFKRPLYSLNTLEYCELDLKKSNDTILAEAKSKWRYHHKKSLSNEILLETESCSDDYIKLNQELSTQWNIRNTFTSREVDPLIVIMDEKLITCTAKDKEGNLLGLRVAIISGNKAYHLYNAVSSSGREFLPGYRLLIYMIDVLRKKGIENFNIGSTNEFRFPGPYRFKTGIGYKESLYTSLGEWNYTDSAIFEKLVNFFIRVYFNSSSLVRKFIKNF